LPRSVRSG